MVEDTMLYTTSGQIAPEVVSHCIDTESAGSLELGMFDIMSNDVVGGQIIKFIHLDDDVSSDVTIFVEDVLFVYNGNLEMNEIQIPPYTSASFQYNESREK